jgi:hypothetical protein
MSRIFCYKLLNSKNVCVERFLRDSTPPNIGIKTDGEEILQGKVEKDCVRPFCYVNVSNWFSLSCIFGLEDRIKENIYYGG